MLKEEQAVEEVVPPDMSNECMPAPDERRAVTNDMTRPIEDRAVEAPGDWVTAAGVAAAESVSEEMPMLEAVEPADAPQRTPQLAPSKQSPMIRVLRSAARSVNAAVVSAARWYEAQSPVNQVALAAAIFAATIGAQALLGPEAVQFTQHAHESVARLAQEHAGGLHILHVPEISGAAAIGAVAKPPMSQQSLAKAARLKSLKAGLLVGAFFVVFLGGLVGLVRWAAKKPLVLQQRTAKQATADTVKKYSIQIGESIGELDKTLVDPHTMKPIEAPDKSDPRAEEYAKVIKPLGAALEQLTETGETTERVNKAKELYKKAKKQVPEKVLKNTIASYYGANALYYLEMFDYQDWATESIKK